MNIIKNLMDFKCRKEHERAMKELKEMQKYVKLGYSTENDIPQNSFKWMPESKKSND